MEYAVEPLFTTKEVSELVGASHLLVRQWIVRGHLPHVELGRYNMVRLKDLEVLLRTGRPPGISNHMLRRSTYSHLGGKSPTEVRNMLWNRYQYSKRKETERRELAGESLDTIPSFTEWVFSGGAESQRALKQIKKQLSGIDLETFLMSISEPEETKE